MQQHGGNLLMLHTRSINRSQKGKGVRLFQIYSSKEKKYNGLILWKGTSRQRSGKGAIRKRFPLQKPRWEKTKLTIRYLYHETYRKPNEQLFSQ